MEARLNNQHVGDVYQVWRKQSPGSRRRRLWISNASGCHLTWARNRGLVFRFLGEGVRPPDTRLQFVTQEWNFRLLGRPQVQLIVPLTDMLESFVVGLQTRTLIFALVWVMPLQEKRKKEKRTRAIHTAIKVQLSSTEHHKSEHRFILITPL